VTSPTTTQLRKTALNGVHRRLKAKMVNFGGWDMPVEYSGIVAEHMATRTAAGLFDVSHMGEIEVRGPRALELVQHVTCNDASKLVVGQAQYSGLMTEKGTFVDDLLVHKISDTHYFLCVNASNQDQDFEHIRAHNRAGAEIENAGARYSQIAIQGPKALGILQRFTPVPLEPIRYYHFAFGKVDGVDCLIARTGYTGEDGFEIYFAPDHSEKLWNKLLDAGTPEGMLPCGLGARNTLRLEAKMALYGHEIDASISPLEADLGWIVKLDKGDFVGRDALLKQKEHGLTRALIGFEMCGRGIGRDGYEVYIDGAPAGWVTSGSPSPTLCKNIGLCYLPVGQAQIGKSIQIMIRNQPVDAVTVETPFYKRAK
jgi:aminomethyltransferase